MFTFFHFAKFGSLEIWNTDFVSFLKTLLIQEIKNDLNFTIIYFTGKS